MFLLVIWRSEVMTAPSFETLFVFPNRGHNPMGTVSTPSGGRDTRQFRVGQSRGLGASRERKIYLGNKNERVWWTTGYREAVEEDDELKIIVTISANVLEWWLCTDTLLSNSSVRFGFQTFFWMESPQTNLFNDIMYTHMFLKQPLSEFWPNNELKAKAIQWNNE